MKTKEQIASEHIVKGTVLVPDANGETMELTYTVWIRPTGDDCEIDLPADLDEDHWEDVEATASDAAYEDAYRKVASANMTITGETEAESLRRWVDQERQETDADEERAARYMLLLDRLDGENTEHGDCRVAHRLEELEGALMDCTKNLVDILDNCLFPAYGLKSNLTPEQAAWRKKVREWLDKARAALKGGAQ